jgi:hypothetical protein
VPRRYVSPDEDSARWSALRSRAGDVVLSTRSKHGTTWVQAIVMMLVLGTAELPAPLVELSPWLDWVGEPLDDVLGRLEAQRHRRVIKTHTPLDGLPLDGATTYVVLARDPLDAAASLYHQGTNIDRERVRELTGQSPSRPSERRASLEDWLAGWIDRDVDPTVALDSLPGVVHHLRDAWERQREPNVVLVRYADLVADREAVMRELAARLGVEVAPARWPELVTASGFDMMRRRAARLAPDMGGVLIDPARFFRSGRVGDGRAALTAEEGARYDARLAALAPSGLVEWLAC